VSCEREVLDEVVAGLGTTIMGVAGADGHSARRGMGWWRDDPFLHALAGGRVVALGQHVVPLGAGEPAAGDLAGVTCP
jgi:hypothetical protein